MSYWKNKGEIKAKFSVHLIVQKDSAKRIASSDSEFRAFSVGFSSALLVDFEVRALMFVLVPQVFSRHRSTHFCWTAVECGFYKSGKWFFIHPSACYIWFEGSCRILHNVSFWSISPNIEIFNSALICC